MELPVARHPGQQATPDALVRAVKRGDAILARMVADEKYLDGATAFTAPQRAAVASANGAADLRLPPGVTASTVLGTIDDHFAGQGVACRWLDASDASWPADLAEAIERRGYRPVTHTVHLLAAYQPPVVDAGLQIIPGRAAYGELRVIFESLARRNGDADPAAQASARIDHLDDSRVDIFLARRQRAPVGVASLLTLGNIGIVLGIDSIAADATGEAAVFDTLAARLIEHCQRAQFEQVIVRLAQGDAALPRFTALGFRPAATHVRYERVVA